MYQNIFVKSSHMQRNRNHCRCVSANFALVTFYKRTLMKKTVGDKKFTGKTHEKQLKNSDFKSLLKCQAVLSHGTYCKDLEYPFNSI